MLSNALIYFWVENWSLKISIPTFSLFETIFNLSKSEQDQTKARNFQPIWKFHTEISSLCTQQPSRLLTKITLARKKTSTPRFRHKDLETGPCKCLHQRLLVQTLVQKGFSVCQNRLGSHKNASHGHPLIRRAEISLQFDSLGTLEAPSVALENYHRRTLGSLSLLNFPVGKLC